MKPKYKGPYIIIRLESDGCSATLEHMYNDRQMKAHFSNIVPICYDPKYNRVNEGFDMDLEAIQNVIPDKTTLGYIPKFSQQAHLYDMEEPRAKFVNDHGRISHEFTEDISVSHTEATVSIGLNNVFRMVTSIL